MGEPATLTRTTSTDQQISPSSRSPKNTRGLNGLRSNPTAANGGQNVTDFASTQKTSPTSPRPGSVPKSPNGRQMSIPRDPAVKDTGDMRDFADFIRSTGPDSDPKNMYKNASASNDKHSRNASNSSQQAGLAGKPLPKKITKHAPVVVPKRPENAPPQRSTSKLKARDPVVSPGNDTADLADFLRSGPPSTAAQMSATVQVQRSPSNQHSPVISNGMVNGRMVSAASIASTQDSFAPSKMTQSSSNSRTALLENAKRGPPVKNNQPQHAGQAEDVGGPVRKQRRVRDPYAIDSDDEDDYDLPAQPAHEEESLSDFLRNYTPPPEPTPNRNAPVSMSETPPAATNTSKERKASGPSIRDRITRNIAVVPDYRPMPPKAPKQNPSKSPPVSNEKHQTSSSQGQRPSSQRQTSTPSNPATSPGPQQRGRPTNATSPAPPQLPPINARATSPHLISQNGTKIDTFRPTRPTYASHVDRARPKPQARDEVASGVGGGGMGDLADFLRDTEPPAPSGPLRMGNSAAATSMSLEPKEEKGGFGRMFGRKRKV